MRPDSVNLEVIYHLLEHLKSFVSRHAPPVHPVEKKIVAKRAFMRASPAGHAYVKHPPYFPVKHHASLIDVLFNIHKVPWSWLYLGKVHHLFIRSVNFDGEVRRMLDI